MYHLTNILVNISEIMGVSTFGRIMFGALAGKAFVRANLELINTGENKKIGILEGEGMSLEDSMFAGRTS